MSTDALRLTQPCRRCRGSGVELDWRDLGHRIRARREAAGWGLRELARFVGCSPAYLSDIEHGRRGGGLGGPKVRAILSVLDIDAARAQEGRGESRAD